MKKISIKGKKFIDILGREIVLRGINIVCKDKSKNYIENISEDDFEYLKNLGFNTIRLGIMWDGLEPEPYKYDMNYLLKLDEIIHQADKYGFYIFLDMHQDLYGVKFCDGAPEWATLDDGAEHVRTELWSEAYLLSPAVQTAFDNFWKNAPCRDGVGVRNHFIKTWQFLAEHYKSFENVIGFDFFNEPFPGSSGAYVMPAIMNRLAQSLETTETNTEQMLFEMWMNPVAKFELLSKFEDEKSYKELISCAEQITQQFDREVLNPFYQEIIHAVRKIDKDVLFFLEANYFCNTGIESALEPVVDENGNADSGIVYSPHGYDILVDTQDYNADCEGRLKVIFETHKKVADRLGVPMMVGEWGCFPDATEIQVRQAEYILNLFEKYDAGNTYFDFSHLKDNKIVEALKKQKK